MTFYNLKDFVQQKICDITHLNLKFFGLKFLNQEEATLLAGQLKTCSTLSYLNLIIHCQKIDSKGQSEIFETIGKIGTIQYLFLNFMFIIVVSKQIIRIQKLLQLRCNQMEDEVIHSLSKSISSLSGSLDTLSISLSKTIYEFAQHQNCQINSKIDNKMASTIAQGLSYCHQITNLALNFIENQIGDQGAEALCIAIANIKKLISLELDLSQNLIGDVGAFIIATTLSSCIQIKKITLIVSKNQITDEGYLELGKCISNLENLQSFECDLKHDEKKLLSQKDIINCKNIKVLTLGMELYEKQIDHKIEALKIKRLVNLKVKYYKDFSF
ncbi:hypothetical protein ABPG72_021206 [Tetrahymena utriculariae]